MYCSETVDNETNWKDTPCIVIKKDGREGMRRIIAMERKREET